MNYRMNRSNNNSTNIVFLMIFLIIDSILLIGYIVLFTELLISNYNEYFYLLWFMPVILIKILSNVDSYIVAIQNKIKDCKDFHFNVTMMGIGISGILFLYLTTNLLILDIEKPLLYVLIASAVEMAIGTVTASLTMVLIKRDDPYPVEYRQLPQIVYPLDQFNSYPYVITQPNYDQNKMIKLNSIHYAP